MDVRPYHVSDKDMDGGHSGRLSWRFKKGRMDRDEVFPQAESR